MQVHVEETRNLRRASAVIRDGGYIQVKVPRHWPRDLKHSTILELVERLQRKDAREKTLLNSKKTTQQARITITTQAELERFVKAINAETFNVPLGKVQIGYARYNHLAQVNLQTKTMTVSKYCLTNAPVDALRYLIIHELAHYFEAGHGPKFWALVERHVPDYRLQSRIMKAFHHQTVIHSSKAPALEDKPASQPIELVSVPNTKAPAKRLAEKPKGRAAMRGTGQPNHAPKPKRAQKDKTGLIPGLIKQLRLWSEG